MLTESSSIGTPVAPGISLPRVATTGELLLVLGLPTALLLGGSLSQGWSNGPIALSDGVLAGTVLVELILTAGLLPFLRRRRWVPGDVAGAPEWRDLVRGVGMWLAAMVGFYTAYLLLYFTAPAWAQALQNQAVTGTVSRFMVIAVSLLNPIFEEFLWLGYGVPALASRVGLTRACLIAVVLRVSVHAYQGPMALVGVLPMAVVFTIYYARTRRLWPLVVAHVIADAVALGTLGMRTS